MPTGNQNYKSTDLMSIGLPASNADAISDSTQSAVAATGTAFATAVTSVADIVLIGSAASNNAGFVLRNGLGFKRMQFVINMGPASATIYPPIVTGAINNTSTFTLTSGSSGLFASVDSSGNQYWKL